MNDLNVKRNPSSAAALDCQTSSPVRRSGNERDPQKPDRQIKSSDLRRQSTRITHDDGCWFYVWPTEAKEKLNLNKNVNLLVDANHSDRFIASESRITVGTDSDAHAS